MSGGDNPSREITIESFSQEGGELRVFFKERFLYNSNEPPCTTFGLNDFKPRSTSIFQINLGLSAAQPCMTNLIFKSIIITITILKVQEHPLQNPGAQQMCYRKQFK